MKPIFTAFLTLAASALPAIAEDAHPLWVTESSPASVCEPKLDDLGELAPIRKKLREKGVRVLGVEKNLDRAALKAAKDCANAKGVLRCFLIRRADLAKAEAAGFRADSGNCGVPSQTRVH